MTVVDIDSSAEERIVATSQGSATGLNLRESQKIYFGGLPTIGNYRYTRPKSGSVPSRTDRTTLALVLHFLRLTAILDSTGTTEISRVFRMLEQFCPKKNSKLVGNLPPHTSETVSGVECF